MKKKGFTLIELLAVIVILAIIALIATPLVLKYIEKARSESTIRSAENYLDAVEHAITAENFKGGGFNPSVCEIKNDGNLLCDDRTIKVEAKGKIPTSGTLEFENWKIKDITLMFNDKIIEKQNNKLVYLKSGLYDAEGNLIASWDELVKDYGIDIEKDYLDENGELIVDDMSELPGALLSQGELSKGTKLVIDSSVKKIGSAALALNITLKEIIIPNSVTSIGVSAFQECTSLKEVIIPNSVTSIGAFAFLYCTSLEKITIPNSVISIGECAFEECSNLKKIIISENVTSISERAFAYCISLEEIIIPNSVTSIGTEAFYGCTSLEKITIPNSITSIGIMAFSVCTSLNTINYTGTTEQWGSISKGSNWDYNTPTNIVYNYVIPQN